jgi:hypothetical protein
VVEINISLVLGTVVKRHAPKKVMGMQLLNERPLECKKSVAPSLQIGLPLEDFIERVRVSLLRRLVRVNAPRVLHSLILNALDLCTDFSDEKIIEAFDVNP